MRDQPVPDCQDIEAEKLPDLAGFQDGLAAGNGDAERFPVHRPDVVE